jgi:hypothetical protein
MINAQYWQQRYLENEIGWDIGAPSTPLKEFIDQLTDLDLRILIPGCGHAYEASYLFEKGFKNVFIADFASQPLEAFAKKHPVFPKNQLIQSDFFELDGRYDLILEQTFFCALDPTLRTNYCIKMASLLSPKGKLAGVLFNTTFEKAGPPFGGTKDEYLPLFRQYFEIEAFDKCKNSIEPRKDRELFIICSTKQSID